MDARESSSIFGRRSNLSGRKVFPLSPEWKRPEPELSVSLSSAQAMEPPKSPDSVTSTPSARAISASLTPMKMSPSCDAMQGRIEFPDDLMKALQRSYSIKDKLPLNNIDGRQLQIVDVQLSLVPSQREKNRREHKFGSVDDEKAIKKESGLSILTRGESDAFRFYEDWHNSKGEGITVNDIFGQENEYSRHVLVLGPAGIGKTTLSQFIAHKWSKGNFWSTVKYVFWLPLRNLGNSKYKDKRMTLAQVLHENCLSPEEQKNVTLSDIEAVLQDPEASSKTLVVMDGFDEVAPHLVESAGDEKTAPTHIQTLFDKACQLGYVILTSRPYQLAPDLLSRFPRQLENRGFNDVQIEAYIIHYFTTLKPSRPDLSKSLLQWLKENPRLSGMSHVPVNISILCAVWHEKAKERDDNDEKDTDILPKDMSLTSLYQEIVDYLLKRYLHEKKGIDARKKDPVYVRERCKRELHFISYLAYRGLIEKKIHLHGRWVEEVLGDWKKTYGQSNPLFSDLSFDDVLSLGFLSTLETNTEEDVAKQDINKTHYFMHLSFQEYFAAAYLVESLKTGKGYKPHWDASKFISDERYNPRFAMVITFAAGLAWKEKSNKIVRELWKSLLVPPSDLTGLGHMRLMLRCLSESDYDSHNPYIAEMQDQLRGGFTKIVQCYLDKENSQVESLFVRDWIPLLSIKMFRMIIKDGLDKIILVLRKKERRLHKHADHFRKKRACQLLGYMREFVIIHEEIIPVLLRVYQEGDSEMKYAVVWTLGKIGEKAAREDVIKTLLEAVQDANPGVRSRAILAIEKMGGQGIRLLKKIFNGNDIDLPYKTVADDILRKIQEKNESETIIQVLQSTTSERSQRGNEVDSGIVDVSDSHLRREPRDADVGALLKESHDKDINKRITAIKNLGKISKENIREDIFLALLDALEDSAGEVRCTAAAILNVASLISCINAYHTTQRSLLKSSKWPKVIARLALFKGVHLKVVKKVPSHKRLLVYILPHGAPDFISPYPGWMKSLIKAFKEQTRPIGLEHACCLPTAEVEEMHEYLADGDKVRPMSPASSTRNIQNRLREVNEPPVTSRPAHSRTPTLVVNNIIMPNNQAPVAIGVEAHADSHSINAGRDISNPNTGNIRKVF